MPDRATHAAYVDAWLKQSAQGLSPEVLLQLFERALGALWARTTTTLGEVTLTTIDFASIEAGRLAIKRQAHDPGLLIQETLASFSDVATKRRLRLTAKVDPQLPKLDGDRERILQVLSNLVGNATKVIAEGGHVTLRVEARGRDLLFAVSDDGPGIGEENVKYLFERYWRGDDPTYKGTGLGLAIAKGIVNAHGGQIWVESQLGHGATFLFTIPAAGAAHRTSGGS